MIQDSPARIYDVAPTLCPPSSWLHEFYSTEFSSKVKAVVGSAGWGICIHTFSCPYPILTLAYWNNIIVTGGQDVNDIIVFDALTGSQIATLSGHTGGIKSLAFSLDGTLLVSGSNDTTVKLWDVQTGGVVKTSFRHAGQVESVSISADNTVVASGSFGDETVRLWNIKTGDSLYIPGQTTFSTIIFSPTNPQLLMYSSLWRVVQCGIDGHQIGSPHAGCYIAFSPDGTQFVSCDKKTVTIRNTDSKMVIMEFNAAGNVSSCCFSPDGRCIAVAVSKTIYLWNTAGCKPYLIQTLAGHTQSINSLVFSSSSTLISGSRDKSVKFWQIGAYSVNPVTPSSESTYFTPAPIIAVSLQAKDGLAFSIDSGGVVKIWDIQTGCCKGSYRTQAKNSIFADMQLINGRLIIIWHQEPRTRVHVCDAEKGELYTVPTTIWDLRDLRILADGSRFLCLEPSVIQAWSIWTGESAGKKALKRDHGYHFDPLHIDGPRVLVHTGESLVQGWDFGVLGSTPIQFSETSSDKPYLNFIGDRRCSGVGPARIEDSVTGKVIFQLCGRYANPYNIRWDGQYLITGFVSGEVLILDFSDVLA